MINDHYLQNKSFQRICLIVIRLLMYFRHVLQSSDTQTDILQIQIYSAKIFTISKGDTIYIINVRSPRGNPEVRRVKLGTLYIHDTIAKYKTIHYYRIKRKRYIR